MRIDRLASYIMRSMWLMDPRAVSAYAPFIAGYLNHELQGRSALTLADESPYLGVTYIDASGRQVQIERDQVKSSNIFSGAMAGSIAVIPVQGVILQDDGMCGEVGTRTISSWVRDALSSDNIAGIMYHVNSPGGQVDGTGDLSRLIMQGRSYKSSTTFCDGLMASAGYWIGSSAEQVFASYETVEIGCIGTMMSWTDNSEMLMKMGIKRVSAYADSSPEKNLDFREAMAGDYTLLKQNLLNPTNDVFLKNVKANREGKLTLTEVEIDGQKYFEPLTGKIYLAESAQANGLIDGVKSFEETADLTAETAYNGGSKNANHQKFFNMSLFNKNPKLTSLVAKGRKNEAITTAELEEANAEMNAGGESGLVLIEKSAVTNLESQLEAAQTAQAKAETALTAMTGERDKYKADAEKYGAQSAEETSNPKLAEGKIEEQGGTSTATVEPWNDPNLEFNRTIDKGRTATRAK